MTSAIRPRRTDWPALVLFGVVYLAALGLVIAPEGLRAGAGVPAETSPFAFSKGER